MSRLPAGPLESNMRWIPITLVALAAMSGPVRLGLADDPDPQAEQRPEPIVLEPAAGPDAPTVRLTPDGPSEPWNPREIGDFTLVDQNGQTVTKDDLLGTPWVVSFIFTRCAFECRNLAGKVHELRSNLHDVDVRFVTITVDSKYDTVERMRNYADIYEAEPPEWLFLTGEEDEIYRLVRSGFKVAAWENFGSDRLPGFEFAHSLSLIHVDAEGGVAGMYGSRDEQELILLQQVLKGRRETPPENRPIPPNAAVTPDAVIESPSTPTPRPPEIGGLDQLPGWAQRLPTTNAMLNALATLLLIVGFSAIKAGQVVLHRRTMLFAFGVSVAFLASYLAYHFALHRYTGTHGKSFAGTGGVAKAYYGILISHVLLAATVPFLAVTTIYRALAGQWDKHRRIARITFPVWLYVSITGVVIYWMLYHWE